MNKRIFLSILVIMMALAAMGGATVAWFTAESEELTNEFTAGTVTIEANESGTYSDPVENWNPGDEDDKNITVEVTGSKTVYLRAHLTEGWEDLQWITGIDDGGRDIDWTVEAEGGEGEYTILRHLWGNDLPNRVNWFIDGDVWPDDEWHYLDGYWYYIGEEATDGVLDPEAVVTFLSRVGLKGAETGNEYQGAKYTINVTFEAIQTTHEAINSEWGVKFEGGEFVLD